MSQISSSPGADVKLTRVFSRTPSSWDPQDDLLLRHLKEQQKLGWKEIASHFAHRTPNACQFRWRRLRSGSLKNSTNSPTPTSGANTPNSTGVAASNSIAAVSSNEQDSSSNSASPPPVASSGQHLVTKFSSIPNKNNSSSPKLKEAKKTQPINVPVYNQWTFHSSNLSSTNLASSKASSNFKDSPDPLSSSLISLHSDSDDIEDDDEDSDDKINTSAVLLDSTITITKDSSPSNWSMEEDELLITRRRRALSFAELSILLPSRTEDEIWSRIDQLDKKTKTKRSNSSRSHSHPHPLHTPSHQSPKPSSFTRSYSSSSQTSISSNNPLLSSSTSNSSSNFFLTQDSTRSKSFSYITPYIQSTDRYNLRKNSITNSIQESSRTRSNSFLQQPHQQSTTTRSSIISNERSLKRDDSVSSTDLDEHDQGLKIEPKLPPLGSIFNDLYTR